MNEATSTSATGIGTRVRELRRAIGMTQDELAAGRFTKQYVSQIERGEIVPSGELLEWLARRLGVDRMQLATGLSTSDYARFESELERGEHLLDVRRSAEAADLFKAVREPLGADAPRPALRAAVRGEVRALTRLGRIQQAADLLGDSRKRAEGPEGSTEERAEVTYLTALCTYLMSEVVVAQAEFDRSLALLDESGVANDGLRSDIHQWRSRCHRRLRDWEAAREDIERALELCEALADTRRIAEVSFQASLVAERQGRWVLARRYAQTTHDIFLEIGDRVGQGIVLNNLAGLNHLLGNDDLAIAQLRESYEACIEADMPVEAGYALSSLADIYRGRGNLTEAESLAAHALELLEGRVDHLPAIGTSQLVLARAYLEQGELEQAEEMLATVDGTFERTESVGHQASSWLTRGDLERARRNEAEAARLYRQAAVALLPTDL